MYFLVVIFLSSGMRPYVVQLPDRASCEAVKAEIEAGAAEAATRHSAGRLVRARCVTGKPE